MSEAQSHDNKDTATDGVSSACDGGLCAAEARSALRSIGLALSVTHNTVTTDIPGTEPEPGRSWRVDHTEEIAWLDRLEAALLPSTSISP